MLQQSPTGSWTASHSQFAHTPPSELAMYKSHMGYQKFHRAVAYALPAFAQTGQTPSFGEDPNLFFSVSPNIQLFTTAAAALQDKPYACELPVMLHAEEAAAPLPAEW